MDKIIRYLRIKYPAGCNHSTVTLASIKTSVTEDVMNEIDINGITYDEETGDYAITFSFADGITAIDKANKRVSDAIDGIIARLNTDSFGLEAWVDKDGVIQVKKGGE